MAKVKYLAREQRKAPPMKAKGTLVSETSDALCGVSDATWSHPLRLPYSLSRNFLANITSAIK